LSKTLVIVQNFSHCPKPKIILKKLSRDDITSHTVPAKVTLYDP